MASPLFLRAAVVLGCSVLLLAMLFAFRSDDRSDRSPPFTENPDIETMNLRCDVLDLENTDDKHCNAVWAENNRRFFSRSTHPITKSDTLRQPKIEGARHE